MVRFQEYGPMCVSMQMIRSFDAAVTAQLKMLIYPTFFSHGGFKKMVAVTHLRDSGENPSLICFHGAASNRIKPFCKLLAL